MKKTNYLFFVFSWICLHSFSQGKGLGQTYNGMGSLSELVMSAKCAIRSNFNLFFESNIAVTDKDRPMIWYKLVFHQPCKLSFTLIPVNESDRYEIEVYKSRPFTVPCSQSLDSAFFKVDSLSKQVKYNDNFQSTTFRQSLFHTREIPVLANESVYIIVNNISGPDAGHVIDVQTCDYSYVLKANKIPVNEPGKIDRSNFRLPGMRLKSVTDKLCNQVKGQEMGYTQFIGEKMITKNFTARALDSANKKQAIALQKMKQQIPVNKTIATLNKDTAKSVKGPVFGKKGDQRANLRGGTNSTIVADTSVHLSKNKHNTGKLNTASARQKLMKDTIGVSQFNNKMSNDVNPVRTTQAKLIFNDTGSVSAKQKTAAGTSSVSQLNKQKVNQPVYENQDSVGPNKKNSAFQPNTGVISSNKSVSDTAAAKNGIKNKLPDPKVQEVLIRKQIKETILSMYEKIGNDNPDASLNDNMIMSVYRLKDSVYELIPEEKKKQPVLLDDKSEKALIKTPQQRLGKNLSPHNITVYFIVVDARNKKVIRSADVRYRVSNTRNFFSTERNDSLSAYKAAFMSNGKMIVECNVFGYHHYKSKFEIDFAIDKDPVYYDFIFMQPLTKGEILELPNVYFYPNSTVLKQSSFKELDKLVNYLNNTLAVIRIDGHTQGNKRIVNKGTNVKKEFQFKGSARKLSKERAERVYEYLLEKDVDKSRLSTRGFAGKRPKIKNPETKSEKEMNMRVEITIMDFLDKKQNGNNY